MWETAVITNAGAALARAWLQGGTLTLDGAWAGSGTLPDEGLFDAADLAHREARLTLTAWEPSESGVTCELQFPPAERGYVCNQIGLFGRLDEGEPTLIALYQDARGVAIPAASELPEFHYRFFAPVAIGNHGELTVKVEHGLYPSWEEFREAFEKISAADIGAVPVTRTVNDKALDKDIQLTAADVGARPDDWTPSAADVGARPSTWTPTAVEIGAVPTSRKINGKPLTGDLSLNASDVGARPNTWRPTAADAGAVPDTRMINGKVLFEDITLTAADVHARPDTWTPTAADVGARPADWTPSAADTGAVPTTRTVNGKSLSEDITLTAADVHARPDTWTPTAADVHARPNTWTPTAVEIGAVPTTRKINGQPLTDDITITGVSGNAESATRLATPHNINGVPFDGTQDITVADNTKVPTSRKINNKPLSADISLAAADVGAVPTSRTINGQALTGDVTLPIPTITSGTEDLTPGESALASGAIYLVYE